MSVTESECPKFAWMVLMFFGLFNLIRGFMHTVLVEYAAVNIAGLDLSFAREAQLLLMMNYGFSNFLLGIALILIALKARNLVPSMILLVSIFSVISGVNVEWVNPTAVFTGRILAIVYLTVGIVSLIGIYLHRRRT